MVSPIELGKLKLEHNIKHGIFITDKTYCTITDENKFINKAKIKITKLYILLFIIK